MALVPTKVSSFSYNDLVKDSGRGLMAIDKSMIPESVRTEIDSAMSQIDLVNQSSITTYGTSSQTGVSNISKSILSGVKTGSAGDVGTALTGLVKNIKSIDMDSIKGNRTGNFITKLFDKIKDPLQTFMIHQQDVSKNIEVITKDLMTKRQELITSSQTLDKMYDQNLQAFRNLQVFIVAGLMKLNEERGGRLVELQAIAESSKDPADVQAYEDYRQCLNRLEKRVHDMAMSRSIAMLTGPAIRQSQANANMLAEELQNSVLTAIPLFEQSVVLSIEAYRQEKAIDAQKMVTGMVNDMLVSNSEKLKTTTIAVAKMSQETMIRFETVAKMQENLLSSIDAVAQIEVEGKKKRADDMAQLSAKENELMTRVSQRTIS